MAQHDMNIANQSFPDFRTDLNNSLSAINSMHSGTSRPSGAVAGTLWLDTTNSGSNSLIVKFYDGSDDITFATINTSANTVDFSDSSIDTVSFKQEGTNFSNSLLIGHSTTGTLSSAEKNTGVGLAALDAITQGDKNVAVGYSSGSSITTGNRNMVFGNEAGDGLTTGSDNVNIGDSAGYYNVSGSENVVIGKSAMQGASGQSNSYNIALGVDALKNITTGGRNIGIGYQSGDNITSGSGNVMIGAGIDLGSATGARQLKIAGNDGSTTTTWISGDSDGVVTFADDIIIKDGGTIGSASDADAMTISSGGVVTFSQNPVFPDGGVDLVDIDIDGGTDIGADLTTSDLIVVDDGAGGTNRKAALSRVVTLMTAQGFVTDDPTALAIALG